MQGSPKHCKHNALRVKDLFRYIPQAGSLIVAARSSIEQAEAKALQACNKKARQMELVSLAVRTAFAVRQRPPLSTARPARFLTEMAANAEGTLGLLEVHKPAAFTNMRQRCGADIYDASVQLSRASSEHSCHGHVAHVRLPSNRSKESMLRRASDRSSRGGRQL